MNHSFLVAVAQAAPQASEQQLLDLDGTVFVMLGLFLVTVFVLNQWLWKPYMRVREERVARVDGYREEAARLEAEAQARLQRVEAQLAEARRAGSAARAQARAASQAREQTILAEAQAAATRALAEARAKLDADFAAAKAKLEGPASLLGQEITEKVLGRRVAS